MRRLSLFLLAFLAMLAVMTEFGGITPGFAAQPGCPTCCSDGQVMTARNACTCRPPLKYLPGNICGSGLRQPGIQQVPNANPNVNVCKNGQNASVTGCRCTSPDPNFGTPRMVYPGGKCDLAPAAGSVCKEGMSWKATHCFCRPPLRRERGYCVR